MSKFKIVRIVDYLFKTVILFLLLFAWFRFYLSSFWNSFLFAVAVTIAIMYLLSIISNKRNGKKSATAKELKQIEDCALNLALMTKKLQIDFLYYALSKKYVCKKTNEGVETELKKEKTLFIVNTKTEKLSKFELLNVLNECVKDYQTVVVICNEFDEGAQKLSVSFKDKKIVLFDKVATFQNFYKKFETLPENELLSDKVNKMTFKEFLLSCVNRKKTKGYFFSGLLLLFASIIIPYSLYYIIFGSSLLVLSLICFVSKNGKNLNSDFFD